MLHLVALDGQAAQLFAQYRSRKEGTSEITGFTRAELDSVSISFFDTNRIFRR